jgi:3-hydroxyisobutyrate dehydrogenase-like beta-hydroxyacid dehydrogenase
MSAAPKDAEIKIGLIGMGDMGKMYARRLLQGGWSRSVGPPRRRPFPALEPLASSSHSSSNSTAPLIA